MLLTPPVFDGNLDLASGPPTIMNAPTDPSTIASSRGHPAPGSLPTPPTLPLTTTDIPSPRKRRKGNPAPKRSFSTPNFDHHQNGDLGMTAAEKKRNKLGYHRTSIACSHCRRRKIRCLAAPDDPHNRCANCIRLKKECNFFPVDQQPPIERRWRNPAPKTEKRAPNPASAPLGNHLLGPIDHPDPFQGLPFSNQGLPAAAAWSSSDLVSPMTRVSVDHRGSFDFNAPPQQQRHHWPSPFHDPSPMSAGQSSPEDASHSYWGRHSDSPLTPAYSPHLSNPATALNGMEVTKNITSFAPTPRNDSIWSAPARSGSIGVVEDFASTYPKHHSYPQALDLDVRRRGPDLQPPSLLTSANSSHASMSDSNMTPLSAPISSPPDTWGVAPGWGTLPSSAGPKPTDYGNWYSEPSLAKVQEEEIPPSYGSQPAIVYSDGDHH